MKGERWVPRTNRKKVSIQEEVNSRWGLIKFDCRL